MLAEAKILGPMCQVSDFPFYSRKSWACCMFHSWVRHVGNRHAPQLHGWLTELWSLFGYPKYSVPYYSRDQRRHHNFDNHNYIRLVGVGVLICCAQLVSFTGSQQENRTLYLQAKSNLAGMLPLLALATTANALCTCFVPVPLFFSDHPSNYKFPSLQAIQVTKNVDWGPALTGRCTSSGPFLH